MSTWLITGASRGFGMEITRAVLESGHSVVATARDPSRVTDQFPDAGEKLLAVPLDVTDEAQARAAVTAATERFGGIDVLVNNAGRGVLGALEEVSDAEIRATFETNVFGAFTMLRAVLPVMRAQRSGHILNMSSVGGIAGAMGWSVYQSSKFALEGMSEAMAAEVGPLGIQVTILEPGYFRTDFLDDSSLAVESKTIDDYADTVGKVRARRADLNHAQPGDPAKGARVIADIAGDRRAPLRLQLGSDCVSRIEAKVRQLTDDLEKWRDVAVSTDHDDVRGG
jgi:NAD(P)-dependent dehydrogenase (short-subunit alcohol dehydrogenase family)